MLKVYKSFTFVDLLSYTEYISILLKATTIIYYYTAPKALHTRIL